MMKDRTQMDMLWRVLQYPVPAYLDLLPDSHSATSDKSEGQIKQPYFVC